jgi:hypothetical protein
LRMLILNIVKRELMLHATWSNVAVRKFFITIDVTATVPRI